MNPMQAPKPITPKRNAKTWGMVHLTIREVRRLFDAAKSNARDALLLRILYRAGLRRSEIGMLRVSDLDLDHGTIQVRRLKGSTSNVIPLGADAVIIAREWLRIRPTETMALFPSRQHGPLCGRQVYEIVRKYGAIAKIDDSKLFAHALKSTVATHMIEAGIPIHDVSANIGHKDIATTAKYYLHVIDPSRLAAVEKLYKRGGLA